MKNNFKRTVYTSDERNPNRGKKDDCCKAGTERYYRKREECN